MDIQLQSIYFKRNIFKHGAAAVLLLFFCANSFAQDKITVKDAKDINYAAVQAVRNIPTLLNFIADPNNTPNELNATIGESFKPSRNRIFYNKDIIIEDDIDPAAILGNTKDVPVEKYLNNLDVYYEKSTDATIAFDSLATSHIKKNDYLYVNVKFESQFGAKNKATNAAYPVRERQALVRVQRNSDNAWEALVVGIGFYDPSKPIHSKDNEIQLYTDTSAAAAVVTQDDAEKEIDVFKITKEQEEKNKQAAFDEYITIATNYVANKQYKDALDIFDKAKALKSFMPSLDKKIIDTKRLASEYTYENFKNKGDKAKNERRYELAIQQYQQALTLSPQQSAVINAEIAPLTKQMSIVSSPSNKVESGQFQQAIDECDKLIRDNKKTKTDFPELFYIKGKAYEALAAQQPGNNKTFVEKALENYNFAIQYFPNYLDARITRADFFIKYQNDYTSAISDYDVLILNALDASPEKPAYLAVRAKMKDKVQNYPSAIDDYTKAIALNKTNALYYFGRGELQYRLNKFDEAQKNFDAALQLDGKFRDAFYFRGLNFVALKNNNGASVDFVSTEKLGFTPAQQKTVDSISNNFFIAGETGLVKHDFATADTAYNNAIKIRKCNALAWHGKAEIRLINAQEMAKNPDKAKASYLESIDLNAQAFACNADFSDAYYKHGLAHHRIGNYDLALKSFGDAIRSNGLNTLALVARGNTYQVQGNYAKAADDYSAAITILKTNYEAAKKASDAVAVKLVIADLSNAQQLNGQALYYNKDYVNSLLALDQAIDYSELNTEALYYRGLVHAQQNDYSKAFKDYNAAIKVNPDFRYFYANATASYSYKNYELAISNYTDAINHDTLATVKNRYYLRGMSFFKNKMYDNAVADFASYEKAGIVKSDSSFYADFGLAKLYNNQDTSAVQYLNKAITIRGTDARALYSLGCAYAKAGQFDKALEYIEKAFATKLLVKDDIKLPESTFLVSLYKEKPMKTKYNALKKQYMEN